MSRNVRPVRDPDPSTKPAPKRATTLKAVEDFSDEALLAELGEENCDGEGGASNDHDTPEESMELLERRLRGELASMSDTMCDEEAQIRAEIEANDDEPDEDTALYLSLMQDETSERAKAKRERMAIESSINDSRHRELIDHLTVDHDTLRHTAVRLKREGDIEGARDALRKSKLVKQKIEQARANGNAQAGTNDSGNNELIRDEFINGEPPITEQDIKTTKMEAIQLKQQGDMEGARFTLRRAKEMQSKLDAQRNFENENESAVPGDTTESASNALDVRASADLQQLMEAARSEALKEDEDEAYDEQSDDPETSSAENEKLLADELGFDHADAHFSGNYDALYVDGQLPDIDPSKILEEQVESLTLQILETKKKALASKRNGDLEGAREFLREAKALQKELDETRNEYSGL